MTQSRQMSTGTLILRSLFTLVFFPLLILLPAGDWRWLEGWLFALWMDAMTLSCMIYLFIKDPALLAERSKMPGSDNQKTWDKYLLSGIYIFFIVWLVVMPLDVKRFGWSPEFPLWLKAVGSIMLLLSFYMIYTTTAENTYLSTMVRIQSERGQQVISTGVYGFVRHPLYLGCILMSFGAPLLLGSISGLIMDILMIAILAGRIIGEEKMLVNELNGYVDYTQKVKYRLIPFIW